jgi:tetratricopeptide (TPR) repeat protein
MVMEDLVVRKAWLNSIIAALCVTGTALTTAEGSPAGNWLRSRPSTSSSGPFVLTQDARPTESISPFRHPIKYMGAAISEMPRPRWAKRDKTPEVTKSKPKVDSISLNTPTGPPTPQLMVATAQICEQKGDVAGARQQYQKALSMWPGNVDALRGAARMEDRLGDLNLAQNLYQQAVNANPQHSGAHNDLGICLARQGKLDLAVQQIEQAITLQPENPLYRNNAATVLVMVQQDQRALAHLAAVHGGAVANYNMGQLLVQRGRAMDAAPYFAAALEIDPTMQVAQTALASLQGQAVGAVPTMASVQPMAPGMPMVMPQQAPPGAPQPGVPSGPELSIPSTASNPAWNSSSYAPPRYYAPAAQPQYQPRPPATPYTPYMSQAPAQYLPPVPPGPQQQRQLQSGTVLR